ncbi:MAG: hypothetical protein AB7F35_04530 [Acetobacteraceae bacterium]
MAIASKPERDGIVEIPTAAGAGQGLGTDPPCHMVWNVATTYGRATWPAQ